MITVEKGRVEVQAFGRVFSYDTDGQEPPVGAALHIPLDRAWAAVGLSIGEFLRKRYEEGPK